MHLQFNHNGKASPNHWVVIDEFGTEHDALFRGVFGGISDRPAHARHTFADSALTDPDYNRAFWLRPKYYRARESVAFSSPIGISIEIDIRIDFELQPSWDERTNEPRWTRDEGATVQILRASTECWDFSPTSTVLTQKALEAFCWAYIDMERAREDAAERQATEGKQ